jgi:hypothetical protein
MSSSVSKGTSAPPLFLQQKETKQTSTPILTEKEVFKILYPDFYGTFLKNIQTALVAEGTIEKSAEVPFETEEDMEYSFALFLFVEGRVVARLVSRWKRAIFPLFSELLVLV